jgi:hypothetical protein
MKNLGSIVEALVLSGAIALGAACGGDGGDAAEAGGGEATQGGEQSCSGEGGGEHSCSGAAQDAPGGDAPADAAGGDAPAPEGATP